MPLPPSKRGEIATVSRTGEKEGGMLVQHHPFFLKEKRKKGLAFSPSYPLRKSERGPELSPARRVAQGRGREKTAHPRLLSSARQKRGGGNESSSYTRQSSDHPGGKKDAILALIFGDWGFGKIDREAGISFPTRARTGREKKEK